MNISSYWQWLLKGTGDKPGYKRIANWHLLIHLLVGCLVTIFMKKPLTEAANTVLLPLSGILVGLTFAWAGNAQAILQTEEFEQFSEYRKGGFAEYVYTYQTAILAILVTLVLWGLAGLGIVDELLPTSNNPPVLIPVGLFIVKCLLFSSASLTISVCWSVVNAAQITLLVRREIKKINNSNKQSHGISTGPNGKEKE